MFSFTKDIGMDPVSYTHLDVYKRQEPTTGLHTDAVKKLLEVLQRLVDAGNTVLVIEHDLDVIKCADFLLDQMCIRDRACPCRGRR